jgi:hypothetical protein
MITFPGEVLCSDQVLGFGDLGPHSRQNWAHLTAGSRRRLLGQHD